MRLFCHWWRNIYESRVSAMELIGIVLVILAIAALAPRLGADSRDLRDHPWERTPR